MRELGLSVYFLTQRPHRFAQKAQSIFNSPIICGYQSLALSARYFATSAFIDGVF